MFFCVLPMYILLGFSVVHRQVVVVSIPFIPYYTLYQDSYPAKYADTHMAPWLRF